MAKVDLRTMTIREMKDLRSRLDKAIGNKEKQEKGKVLNQIRATAKAAGYNLDELMKGKAPAKRKRKLLPKYKHPQNSEITWSGVGRKPKWIVEAEKAGKLEKLKI